MCVENVRTITPSPPISSYQFLMDVDLAAIMRVIGGKSSSRGYLKHVAVIFKALLCNYNMYALIENADNV